jgi:photosystem II stability/assembly factor-like uncharacterized protein
VKRKVCALAVACIGLGLSFAALDQVRVKDCQNPAPRRHGLALSDIKNLAATKKAELKAGLKAEGKLYEPGQFPNEWAYHQRAYPYGRVDPKQLRNAIVEARARRLDALSSKAGWGTLSGNWQERGPDNIGARVTDLAIHPTNPNIVYAAHATSGVLKTTDGGASWFPISDDLPVLTIGAIALDPTNPDVLYVGTGEANANSYSFFGMGIYKSTDAGATWTYAGLEDSYYIARIVVDPVNSDRIWVAATGALFGTNPERGIYRSLDAGASWQLVLSVSDSTAATDVAIDPSRPDTVFAAMWERVRGLTYRRSGGATSAIYRSYDGGDSWTKLTNGLPSGTTVGRIGISVCAANPSVVYAAYADHPGYFAGVYKSTNGGNSWARTTDAALDGIYSNFGWYFGQMRVDPTNANRVFVLGVPFYRSQDGGSSWAEVGPTNHVDHHAMAFDPTTPARIFEGNDGGIYVSANSGTSWTKLYDQPTNQFYAIEIDYQNPARLYGGTQDNGTIRTATGGTSDWEEIFGGDGFYSIVDPTDSDIIYCEYQYGNLYKSADFGYSWDYALDGISGSDRRNWSTPVVMDPSNHLNLYYGTYRVYKSTDGAVSWTATSTDLTNGNQGGNYGTITTIAVAPADPDVIYVGTDDSNVWVTQNGGGAWTNVSAALPNRWVTRVAVDPETAGTAYVTFSGLRWNEDIGYVYRTEDYGASWTDITGNLPGAPVNVLAVDPDEPVRLFVGTDVGCFYSEDIGDTWQMLGVGLPPVPVYDIKIHGPTRTLVAGTHGRSMHSFDLSTLPDLAGATPGPGVPVVNLSGSPNPFKTNTTIAFSLTQGSDVSLAIYDLAGRRVRTLLKDHATEGAHRAIWDGTNDSGHAVASGIYFARLQTGAVASTTTLNLVR